MIYLRLGADLERDSRGGSIGIIHCLRTGFDVRAHAVVVARSEGTEVGETMESDRVLGRRET